MTHFELEKEHWKLWHRLGRQDTINKRLSREIIWLWVMVGIGAVTNLIQSWPGEGD